VILAPGGRQPNNTTVSMYTYTHASQQNNEHMYVQTHHT